jgi:malonate transporter MadL subunit
MKIYGVALLAFCFLLGKLLGGILGKFIGIDGDIGGVGFAMILLISIRLILQKRGVLSEESEKGVLFWSAMYIPIIVAMAAIQNVKAALVGGWVAVVAGGLVALSCFLLVLPISRIGANKAADKQP